MLPKGFIVWLHNVVSCVNSSIFHLRHVWFWAHVWSGATVYFSPPTLPLWVIKFQPWGQGGKQVFQAYHGLLFTVQVILSYLGRMQLPFNWRNPENNSLKRQKNNKERIINHKGTRMVKDGEDWHGLQTTNFKNLCSTFQDIAIVTCSLIKWTSRSLCQKGRVEWYMCWGLGCEVKKIF